MTHSQANHFIARAHTLTKAKRTRSASTPAHPALTLLQAHTRLIRGGLELGMNNLQIADSIQTLPGVCHRIHRMKLTTLSTYISKVRRHYDMPRTRGFVSQW